MSTVHHMHRISRSQILRLEQPSFAPVSTKEKKCCFQLKCKHPAVVEVKFFSSVGYAIMFMIDLEIDRVDRSRRSMCDRVESTSRLLIDRVESIDDN